MKAPLFVWILDFVAEAPFHFVFCGMTVCRESPRAFLLLKPRVFSRRLSLFLPLAFVLFVAGILAPGAPSEITPSEVEFFETRIRPVLIEHCYECHSVERGRIKGGLELDSRAGLLKGGDSGSVLAPQDPERSRLIEAVRYINPDFQMPPKNPLPKALVHDLETWVRMGAPDPRIRVQPSQNASRPMSVEEGRRFWSFQGIVPPEPPVSNGVGVSKAAGSSAIDRFLEARLENTGLRCAEPVDKRGLLRRLTFDLTGLPPTPEEVDDFVADESPGAYGRVVSRLLDSPAYGERWGRHWLDVARYADSNGLDENVALGNAWRYRDYVVESFNGDKPYDRFIREQVAGDLLPAQTLTARRENLSALGFLSIGPKLLAEVDKVKMEMDLIDEQIDTIGRAFMGLTLGCARCHSHKFDPVPTEDYYGLAAILKGTRTMDDFKTIAKWHESSLASPEEQERFDAHQRKVNFEKAVLADLIANANEELLGEKGLVQLPLKPEVMYPTETLAAIKEARDRVSTLEKYAPELPVAMGVVDKGEVVERLPVFVRGSHLNPGREVSRGFLQVTRKPGEAWTFSSNQSGRLELAQWLTSPEHPLVARVMVNRIWRWHFGRGLVATTDNFGVLGDGPSHPELLDWLACRFIEEGWSIKAMHRLIVGSAAYKRSARPVDSGLQSVVDPANRLLSYFPPRRLDAEEIRDALHSAAGMLDRTMGGKTIPQKNREFVFNHTSKDATTYESPRRALYLPVIRNNVYDLFEQFDFPDPAVSNGNRASTVVASQALLMLNSPLVLNAARRMAVALMEEPLDSAGRVSLAYLRAYGRDATAAELDRALRYLADVESSRAEAVEQRWVSFCHLLFAANEFVYLN